MHLETRASPLQEVGRTRPSQRAGAKSPTLVITRSCNFNIDFQLCERTFGRLARIVSWSGLIHRSWRRTRSYSVELATKAAMAAIWGEFTMLMNIFLKLHGWKGGAGTHPFCFVFRSKRGRRSPNIQGQYSVTGNKYCTVNTWKLVKLETAGYWKEKCKLVSPELVVVRWVWESRSLYEQNQHRNHWKSTKY